MSKQEIWDREIERKREEERERETCIVEEGMKMSTDDRNLQFDFISTAAVICVFIFKPK